MTAKLNDASLGALERAHLLRLRGLLHWQQQSHVAAIYDLLSVNRAVLDDVLLSPQCLYHFFAMLSSSEQMQVSVRCEHALAAWPVAQRYAQSRYHSCQSRANVARILGAVSRLHFASTPPLWKARRTRAAATRWHSCW